MNSKVVEGFKVLIAILISTLKMETCSSRTFVCPEDYTAQRIQETTRNHCVIFNKLYEKYFTILKLPFTALLAVCTCTNTLI
jgi:NADH:ubiquinone oxidoreductase subunit 6 (subunit J)